MGIDPRGRALLAKLNLDAFEAGDPAPFAGIEASWRYLVVVLNRLSCRAKTPLALPLVILATTVTGSGILVWQG